jgi:uroporphyrinogen-III synthase
MSGKTGSVRKILLTRAPEDNSALRIELEKLGFRVIEIPALETVALKPSNDGEIAAKWNSFGWMVFSSRRAVRHLLGWMKEKNLEFPLKTRYAAVGKGTGEELSAAGVKTDVMPPVEDGEHLGTCLLGAFPPSTAFFPSSRGGLRTAQEILIKGNWAVSELELYETIPRKIRDEELSLLKEGADLAFFASPSAFSAFADSPSAFRAISRTKVLPIGATTLGRASELGLNAISPPGDTSLTAILKTIREYFRMSAP